MNCFKYFKSIMLKLIVIKSFTLTFNVKFVIVFHLLIMKIWLEISCSNPQNLMKVFIRKSWSVVQASSIRDHLVILFILFENGKGV